MILLVFGLALVLLALVLLLLLRPRGAPSTPSQAPPPTGAAPYSKLAPIEQPPLKEKEHLQGVVKVKGNGDGGKSSNH